MFRMWVTRYLIRLAKVTCVMGDTYDLLIEAELREGEALF